MKLGTRGLVWAAILILTALVAHGAALAETRMCATADVEERFVMPDGAEHAPGKLTLCQSTEFSPARAIHEAYVDRHPVSMVFSVRGRSEAPTITEPYMMFSRDPYGRLRLYGFSFPGQNGMETFLFDA